MLKIAVTFGVITCCQVAANLLMKIGALSPPDDKILFGILGWQSVIGLGFFAGAAMIYAWALQWLPLNVAQSFMAAQFIAVVFAASLVLSEPISFGRWIGIVLIATGIFTVALSYSR